MANEIWKDISGYEGLYQVSTDGRIRGVERVVKHSTGSPKKIKSMIIKKKEIWEREAA